jgi:phosphoglycolate phosphatase-like HAD superfamily hydrolase
MEAEATERELKVDVLRHVEKKPSYECGRELLAALNNPDPRTVVMVGDRVG